MGSARPERAADWRSVATVDWGSQSLYDDHRPVRRSAGGELGQRWKWQFPAPVS